MPSESNAISVISTLVAILTAVGLWSATLPARAQAFPVRTITISVGNPPGGTTDWMARAFGGELQKRWGQSVVIENKPGANGLIALNAMQKAPPDGHTLLMWSPSVVHLPLFVKDTSMVIGKDIQPLTPVAFYTHVLLAPSQLQVRTLNEFLALVKANPGKFNVASPGNGASLLDVAAFLRATGLQMQLIPYKGGHPAMLRSIMTNETQFYLSSPFGLDEQIKAGNVIALAVSWSRRFPALPNVPTVKEASGVDFEGGIQLGFFTTAGTPRPAVDRLARELADLANGELSAQIRKLGFEPLTMSPDEWSASINAEGRRGREVAQALGLKPE